MLASVSLGGLLGYGDDAGQGYTMGGQSVADAAYGLAHRYPGGVPALAARMGVSPNTLTHKVNPNNDTHKLALGEAEQMSVLSGDAAILHAFAAQMGHVCLRATPDTSEGDPLDNMAALQAQMADLMRAVADAVRGGQGAVTANQARRVDHHAQEAMAAIGHTVAMVRSRMRARPEGV